MKCPNLDVFDKMEDDSTAFDILLFLYGEISAEVELRKNTVCEYWDEDAMASSYRDACHKRENIRKKIREIYDRKKQAME